MTRDAPSLPTLLTTSGHLPAPAISAADLSIGPAPGVVILGGISFRVEPGQIAALLGANGAGKSTLLRAIAGTGFVHAGRLEVLGQPVGSKGCVRRGRLPVSLIFQRPALVPGFSALTNVLHGHLGAIGWRALHQAIAPRADREWAMHCLDRVGLAGLALRPAGRLSGGEGQRVAIARALARRPRLLLADEPTASLDPRRGDEVLDLLVHLCRVEGMTLLFSTHTVFQATRLADRILGLVGGRLALDEAAGALDADRLEALYG